MLDTICKRYGYTREYVLNLTDEQIDLILSRISDENIMEYNTQKQQENKKEDKNTVSNEAFWSKLKSIS